MAQATNIKSQGITYLDQTPPAFGAPNQGANHGRIVVGSVLAVSGDNTSSTYKMVRVPSNAKIKTVLMESAIAGAGNADLNIVWSDSASDGTSATNQGTVPQISSANNKLFGSALSMVAIGRSSATYTLCDLTYANTTNFPQGLGANAAITAAIAAGFSGYPTSGTALTTESANTPLWQMLGLGSVNAGDPGGWFDFVFYITTGVTTGGVVTLQVEYVI